MNAIRHLAALTLVLVLAMTSQGLAVARGQGAAVGSIVICIGGGLAAVPVGPDGQPVGEAHYCPDGVLSLLAGPVAGSLPAAPMRLAVAEPAAPADPGPAPQAAVVLPQARAPPFPV